MAKNKKRSTTKILENEVHLELSIPYLLHRISNALTQKFRDGMSTKKVNVSEWRILSSLMSRGGNSTIGEIARCTVIKQPIVSRIVTELDQKGMVEKKPGEQDQRVIHVQITEDGEELFYSLLPLAIETRKLLVRGFTRDEARLLNGLLKKMQHNLDIGLSPKLRHSGSSK